GEAAQPPIFLLGHRPALLGDDSREGLGQGLDLGGGRVLARDEYVLVKRHAWHSPYGCSRPGAGGTSDISRPGLAGSPQTRRQGFRRGPRRSGALYTISLAAQRLRPSRPGPPPFRRRIAIIPTYQWVISAHSVGSSGWLYSPPLPVRIRLPTKNFTPG